MSGAPAPIDGIIDQVRKIRDQLEKLGPQVGGASPVSTLADPVFIDLRRALRRDAANLPPPVNALVAEIAQLAEGSVIFDAPMELERLYRGYVVAPCPLFVSSRYP